MRHIEILSPAGSIESVKAAINASCDAIYIGGSKFGARAYANNPDQDDLLQLIEYAHIHDKKVYLTVNTLLKNNELKDELYEYLYKYYMKGLDAVIVQDLGVVHFIHEHFPKLPIHGSTQLSLNMAEGANVLLDYGMTRFVPGRELSLEELSDIRKKTDLEIEIFVHGSLCYSYSGQCLMSSAFNGRSGNRGRCAQPCRMPYSLIGEKTGKGNEKTHLSSENEKYLISPKDISTLDFIPDFIDGGIDSLKIEGRMKSPEYTAITTYTYNKYVDKYLELGREGYERYLYDNKKEYDQDKTNLLDIYNRGGFSDGYLKQRNGRSMITLDKPNHSGVEVGSLSKVTKKHIWIDLTKDINKGDVLRVIGKDRDLNSYEYITGLALKAGQTADTNYDRRITLSVGDKVFRVRNNELIDYLSDKYVNGLEQIPIKGSVEAIVGQELTISLQKDDIIITIVGDIVEEAKKQPMTEEKIRKQVSKINDTNFVFANLDINIKGKPFIAVSKLNELRRQAIIKLEAAIIKSFYRDEPDELNLEPTKPNNITFNSKKDIVNEPKKKSKVGMNVVVKTKDQLHVAVNQPEVSGIYIDSDIGVAKDLPALVAYIKTSNKKAYLYMPHIFRKTSYEYFESILEQRNNILVDENLDGFVIRNLEEYEFLMSHIYNKNSNKEIITDYNLYVMNEETVKIWNELGVHKLTAPVELNKHELKELRGLYYNIIVYGRTPLMVTAQCPMKTVSGGDNKPLKKARDNYNFGHECCGQDYHNIELVDRLNVKFPVVRNCRHCYNIIYNSLPLSLLSNSKEVLELKPSNIRLDFTIESKEETSEILDKFIQTYYYNKKIKDLDEFTRLHFNRGIQ